MSFNGITLPNITENGLGDAAERRQILEALYQLNQQLRYMMDNIGVENLDEDLLNFVNDVGGQYREFGRTIEDLQGNISRIQQTARDIILSVEDADNRIAALTVTAREIAFRVYGESRVYRQNTPPVPSLVTPVEDGDLWVNTSSATDVYRFENGVWVLTDGKVVDERISRAETNIIQNADRISLSVQRDGVIAAINMTSEMITIAANRINFNGAISANGNFRIYPDGTMEAVNGVFNGTMTAGSWTFNQNGMRFVSGGNYVEMGRSGGNAWFSSQGFNMEYGSNNYMTTTVKGELIVLRCTDSMSGQSVIAMSGYAGSYAYNDVCLLCEQAGASFSPATSRGNIGITDMRWDVLWCRVIHYLTFVSESSREVKEDIEPMEDMGLTIDGLEPVTYRYKNGDGKRRLGLIYEDTVDILPEICHAEAENGKTILGIDYVELVPVLLREIKDLRRRVAALEGVA